jgi:hypothetical protein
MDKVVVWGTSGHALVVVDILRLQAKYDVVGFLDNIHPDRYGAFFCNAPILGDMSNWTSFTRKALVTSSLVLATIVHGWNYPKK